MPVFMTKYTGQFGMSRFCFYESVRCALMASSTIFIRDVLTVGNSQRPVCGVAGKAVFVHHIVRMTLMAIQA